MNMLSKNQYLTTFLIKKSKGYRLKSKKQKSNLLDEYCRNTSQNRKYVIRKISSGKYFPDRTAFKRKKGKYYDSYVVVALIRCWKIFDYACGQRLAPLLKSEVDRLRKLDELKCSDEAALKLKKISFRTIDEKLKKQKEAERLKRKYHKKIHPLLYQKIPVKIASEQDRNKFGNLQIDLVEHCGQSPAGEYICTLSNTDIATGWWEGEAVAGRGQRAVFEGLKEQRQRFPFAWQEIHSDNGAEFINNHLWRYTQRENLGFSRSRPYKKNRSKKIEKKLKNKNF